MNLRFTLLAASLEHKPGTLSSRVKSTASCFTGLTLRACQKEADGKPAMTAFYRAHCEAQTCTRAFVRDQGQQCSVALCLIALLLLDGHSKRAAFWTQL